MGALGDFFQGAYAYSEQERLRQVEEDNKFKLYEKQQRLLNSLADEDRKTQVVEWEPRPDEGVMVGLNANGDVVTTRPMDKMTQKNARLGLAKAESDQAKSALDLFINEQTGLSSAQAEIYYRNALTDTTRKQGSYYDKLGDAAGKPGAEGGGLTGADATALDNTAKGAITELSAEFGPDDPDNGLIGVTADDLESLRAAVSAPVASRAAGIKLINDTRAEIERDIKARRAAAERKRPPREGRSGQR